MMQQNVTDTLNTLQAMLQPTAEIRQTMRTNLEGFWNNQDQVLGSMEEFINGWIERRHVGTHAALTTAQRMCDTKTGFDLMKEYQTWAVGSVERIMADSSALQKHLMTVAGIFTKPLTPAEKESTAKAEKESAPKAMAIRTLAASGLLATTRLEISEEVSCAILVTAVVGMVINPEAWSHSSPPQLDPKFGARTFVSSSS